jgi:hypothetical protein
MELRMGFTLVGTVSRALYTDKTKKGKDYYKFTLNTYTHSKVSVSIYGDLSDTMKTHLNRVGAPIIVSASKVQVWVPEDDDKNIIRYTKEGYNKGKVVTNLSATTDAWGLIFVPKERTDNSGSESDSDSDGEPSTDTVRSGASNSSGSGEADWGSDWD